MQYKREVPRLFVKPDPREGKSEGASVDLRSRRTLTDEDHEKRMKRQKIQKREGVVLGKNIGPFYWEKDLPDKSVERLVFLYDFFTTKHRMQKILVPITSLISKLSLRILDWFVINYSRRHHISISKENGSVVRIYDDYRAWLRHWKRSLFDPFRRGHRVFYTCDGMRYSTTVGQLNYLYWVEISGVLHFANSNLTLIEKDMNDRLKECQLEKSLKKKSGQKRKRSDLCKAPSVECVIIFKPVIIHF
jgi:hypothetical protein